MGSVTALNHGCSMWRMRASSTLVMIGSLSTICRHDAGAGSRMLPSGPTVDSIEVTSSSRIWSSGGFVGVAKGDLPREDGGMVGLRERMRRKVFQMHEVLAEPLGIRMLGGELRLDLLVFNDSSLLGVDEDDLPGVQALLDQDAFGGD